MSRYKTNLTAVVMMFDSSNHILLSDSGLPTAKVELLTPLSRMARDVSPHLRGMDIRYKGVIGVRSFNRESVFHFEFAILCHYSSTTDDFVSQQKALDVLADSPWHSLLSSYYSTLPDPLPILLPSEENKTWKKIERDLDLVAFVIDVDADDNILLVQERTGKWFLPAGHFEAGEDIAAAAIRETKEEAGLDITVSKICEIVYGTSAKYAPLHFVVIPETSTGELKSTADHESNCAQRFPIHKVIEEMNSKQDKEKYRKPWEIRPFLINYLNVRNNNNFIPAIPHK